MKGELHEYSWKNRIDDLRTRERDYGAGRSSARHDGRSGDDRGGEQRNASGSTDGHVISNLARRGAGRHHRR